MLGIGLVVAELPINFAWATAVGDGTGFGSESSHYCANKTPCLASGCVSIGTEYGVASDIQSTGSCKSTIFSSYTCTKFSTYVCAKVDCYASRNAAGVCWNYTATVYAQVSNGCI